MALLLLSRAVFGEYLASRNLDLAKEAAINPCFLCMDIAGSQCRSVFGDVLPKEFMLLPTGPLGSGELYWRETKHNGL